MKPLANSMRSTGSREVIRNSAAREVAHPTDQEIHYDQDQLRWGVRDKPGGLA